MEATGAEKECFQKKNSLCVYGAVRGVGGIDSWQSDVEDEYHISAEEDIRYSFTIC